MSKKNISAAIEDILDRIGEPATSVPSSADDLGMIPANAETIQQKVPGNENVDSCRNASGSS